MNLFILSLSARRCARYYFDSHVIKIILEAVQLLCTAKLVLDPPKNGGYADSPPQLYRITHLNHPVSRWVRESEGNWKWTCRLVKYLLKEWRFRYNHQKVHGCERLYKWLKSHPPSFDKHELTSFTLAMPPMYKQDEAPRKGVPSAIAAYRDYYMGVEKAHLRKWRRRGQPYWFKK